MEASISRRKPFKQDYVNGAPYGGMVRNSHGFGKYGQQLVKEDGALISGENKKMLFTENKTSGGLNTGMCFTWFKGKAEDFEYYSHIGGGGGYYCELRLYPDLKLGGFIIFNRSGFKDERYLSRLDINILKNSNK